MKSAQTKSNRVIILLVLTILLSSTFIVFSKQANALTVNDFFLTEEELPVPWIPEPGTYWPGLHMEAREKLMGGKWWSVRIRDSALTKALHVTIGYFPSVAEAKNFIDPNKYIFRTDAYKVTGQTLPELILQQNEVGYYFSNGSIYGDEGFSGGYRLQFHPGVRDEPFNVFRIGQVIFHTDASDPSSEGIIEPLLVDKARLLLNIPKPADDDGDGVPNDADNCPGTPSGVSVDRYGCALPLSMAISLSTDKSTYALGETVIISGQVTNDNGTLAGAVISIDINNSTRLSTVSDNSGTYRSSFTIPANSSTVSYQINVTATCAGYQSAGNQVIFTIGQILNVLIRTDKDYYLIGDPVHCTITLKDDAGDPVPYADLTVTTTHLGSGRTETFIGQSDALGENLWDFIWGKDADGKTISEGKLIIEVNAGKDGYNAGSASITLSGCGDLVHNDGEDCFVCPEDCACGPNEVCDPSSDYKDTATMCSPKVACIFISNGLSWYEKWWASDDIKGIRKKYRKLGYKLTPNIYVDDINDVAKYLSRPSTKAIAYAGHGPDAGKPGIETVDSDAIPSMIIMSNRSAGSFLYRCRYEIYADKWVDLQNRIEAAAMKKVNNPELDYVFMFSCYSLDNFSLRDYLLKSGGTYWGYRGKLPGNGTLLKSVKP